MDESAQSFMVTNRQLVAARALCNMGQIELAAQARVSIGTIRRMETLQGPIRCHSLTLQRVQKALQCAGVEFIEDGVRMNLPTGKKNAS